MHHQQILDTEFPLPGAHRCADVGGAGRGNDGIDQGVFSVDRAGPIEHDDAHQAPRGSRGQLSERCIHLPQQSLALFLGAHRASHLAGDIADLLERIRGIQLEQGDPTFRTIRRVAVVL